MSRKITNNKQTSGPVKVGKYTVRIDRALCIGAATCMAIAPRAYELDEEAKAVILKTADEETHEVILDSAKGCPTNAIIIENKKGKRVYPKE